MDNYGTIEDNVTREGDRLDGCAVYPVHARYSRTDSLAPNAVLDPLYDSAKPANCIICPPKNPHCDRALCCRDDPNRATLTLR